MKKILVVLATIMFALAFAQEQKRISIAVYPDLDSHLNNVLPQFKEQNPNIDVEVRVLQHGDHHNALVTALATGSGAADVVAIDVGFIARFIAEGGLVDLNSAYNASQYADIFADYAWLQASTTDGRQVAMPTDLGPGVMYFRRDRFDEVGANVDQVIESWDSYLDFGRQVSRDTDGDGRNDVYLIADAADIANIVIRSNLGEGEGVFFDEQGNTLINSERFHEAFRLAKAVRDGNMDAQIGSWTNEWYEAFRRGTVATQFSGAWLIGHLQNWMAPETAGLWGAANLPAGNYASWGGSFYGIPEQSNNKDAAWKLIEFLTTNEDVQLAAFERIGAFPALPATYDDPIFEQPIDFLAGQQARILFADVAQNIEGTATHPNDEIANEIVQSALAQVLDEGADIGSALAEAEMLIMRRTR